MKRIIHLQSRCHHSIFLFGTLIPQSSFAHTLGEARQRIVHRTHDTAFTRNLHLRHPETFALIAAAFRFYWLV